MRFLFKRLAAPQSGRRLAQMRAKVFLLFGSRRPFLITRQVLLLTVVEPWGALKAGLEMAQQEEVHMVVCETTTGNLCYMFLNRGDVLCGAGKANTQAAAARMCLAAGQTSVCGACEGSLCESRAAEHETGSLLRLLFRYFP